MPHEATPFRSNPQNLAYAKAASKFRRVLRLGFDSFVHITERGTNMQILKRAYPPLPDLRNNRVCDPTSKPPPHYAKG